jgi:HAMP domain-containing protein
MSQSTFDDDDLFGEAVEEMREEVESHLNEAWDALPAPDDIWETSADNVLGVLNGLRSSLDAGDAEDHLRQAKKQFVLGKRADAFDDAEDLEAEIAEIEEVVTMLSDAHEQVGELASTIPELRTSLESDDEDDE